MSDTPSYAETYTEIDTDDGFFSHLSWGAIFGGLAIAIAVQVVLTLIGIAVGMAAAGADHPRPMGPDMHRAHAIGIGEGLWYLVSTLAAIFTGAAVAARLAGAVLRDDGVLHGLVTWAVSLIAALFLLSSAAGSLAGGPLQGVGIVHHHPGMGGPEMGGPGAGMPDELDRMMAGGGVNMTPEQTRIDLHMQMGRLAVDPNDTAARSRAAADLQSEGVSATDANNRITEWQQHAEQAKDDAAKAITWGALWAALSLILGAGAAAFGGFLGARWAAESAGLDLYPTK